MLSMFALGRRPHRALAGFFEPTGEVVWAADLSRQIPQMSVFLYLCRPVSDRIVQQNELKQIFPVMFKGGRLACLIHE
jgi:hypothetical protein